MGEELVVVLLLLAVGNIAVTVLYKIIDWWYK